MANTQGSLAIAVAGYLQRDPTVFKRTVGSTTVDCLLQACNNARLYAERKVDLELTKAAVTVPFTGVTTAADLSTAVLYGTNTAASVKKILSPFIAMSDGTQFPIDLWTKRKWNDRLKMRFEGARPTDTTDYAFITDSPFVLVQDGSQIFIAPSDSTAFVGAFNVYLDCYLWLPTYSTGNESDILLTYCFDWMMYRCIYELNFFLKEDERVQISEKLMADAWDSLVKWNNGLIALATDDVDLD